MNHVSCIPSQAVDPRIDPHKVRAGLAYVNAAWCMHIRTAGSYALLFTDQAVSNDDIYLQSKLSEHQIGYETQGVRWLMRYATTYTGQTSLDGPTLSQSLHLQRHACAVPESKIANIPGFEPSWGSLAVRARMRWLRGVRWLIARHSVCICDRFAPLSVEANDLSCTECCHMSMPFLRIALSPLVAWACLPSAQCRHVRRSHRSNLDGIENLREASAMYV